MKDVLNKKLRSVVRLLKKNPETEIVYKYNPGGIHFTVNSVEYELSKIELMTLVLRNIVVPQEDMQDKTRVFKMLG